MAKADLTGKTKEELVEISKELGGTPHPNATEKDLARHIEAQPQAFVDKALLHPTQREAAIPTHVNSKEDVLKAIKPFLEKEGFTANFPGDDTWIFECKGAQDSGHLNIPLRNIRNAAEFVSRGRRGLRVLVKDGPGYTGNVLSV